MEKQNPRKTGALKKNRFVWTILLHHHALLHRCKFPRLNPDQIDSRSQGMGLPIEPVRAGGFLFIDQAGDLPPGDVVNRIIDKLRFGQLIGNRGLRIEGIRIGWQ